MTSVSAALLSLALLLIPDQADDAYQFIVGLCEKEMYELAVDEAQSFLRKHPRHDKADHARYRLATALFELDRFDRAVPHFNKLQTVSGFEFEAEVAFRLGQSELELKRYDRAADGFRRTLKLSKKYLWPPARFLLGESAFRKGDYAEAHTAYRQVLERDPDSEYARDARYGLAWCAFRLKQYDAAIEAIDDFRRRHRKGTDDALADELRFLKGECHLEAGRHREAITAYQKVDQGPFLDASLRGSGFALAQLNQHAAAAQAFADLMRRCPESRFLREATLQCGIQHLKAGQAQAALAALTETKGVSDTPDAELLYWTSRARTEAGDLEGALLDLDRALRQKPGDDLAERCQVARGDLLFDLGRTQDAARAYGSSSSDYALHSAAVASLNDRRYDDARTLATRFLAEYPKSPYRSQTHLVLGECELSAKRYRRAAEQFERAMKTAGDRTLKIRALSRLSWCHFLSDDLQTAAQGFAQVAQNGAPEDRPEALFMLGRSLESLGHKPEAARAWQRYLTDHPEGPHRADVLIGLARLEPDEAGIARLEELIERHADHAAAPEALFNLAERLVKSDRRDSAMTHYRELLERFPNHALSGPAQYGLAWCLYEQKQFEQAARQLRELGARPKLDADLYVSGVELLIWAEQEAGNGPGCVRAFESFRKVCRDEQRLLAAGRVAAQALDGQGLKQDAETLWKRLAKSAGSETLARAARIERVYLLLDLDNLAEAVGEIRSAARATDPTPALAEAAFFVGEALFEAGEFNQAAPLYELAGNTEGTKLRDRARYKLGFTRMRLDDLEGAAGAFGALTTTFTDSPLLGESLFLEGEMLYRLERFEEAIVRFERLRAEVPKHEVMHKALFRLGLACGRIEQWSKAEAALTELVRKAPKFEQLAEAELWRGRALSARNNPRSARQAFDRVIALDQGVLSARARIELGRLHYAADEPEKALSEFLKVAVLYGTEAEVSEGLFLAGLCLEKIGDRKRARSQYQEIVQKYPRSSFADQARQRIQQLKTF